MSIILLDIDDCSPNPCQNGATCLDGIDNYTCACADGYMDDNCSTSKFLYKFYLVRNASKIAMLFNPFVSLKKL